MNPIGIVQSCFTEKFGVPRQSMMVNAATGVLKFNPEYQSAFEYLETFSHLWVIFLFHKNLEKAWKPTINPPRVSGPQRVGVFASRSPHRPNPIGLSCVKIEKINKLDFEIHVSGLDILDGSPILDIKPYLPYADSIPDATAGWASDEILKYPVTFSPQSLTQIENINAKFHPNLKGLLIQMLELDPRPTSQRQAIPIDKVESEGRHFAFRLFDFDVQWCIQNQGVYVKTLA